MFCTAFDYEDYYTPAPASAKLWVDYFGRFSDEFPFSRNDFFRDIKNSLKTDAHWLDLLQTTARWGAFSEADLKEVNKLLQEEHVAYRFIGTAKSGSATLMPISDEAEAEANQQDYASLAGVDAAQTHFRSSVERLKSGDYRSSISESIHGVESVAKRVSGKPNATLGDALKVIQKGTPLNPALQKGLTAIYGWSSQDDGIRHAMSDEAQNVDEAEARFMLSACLAFAAWLKRAAATIE